MPGFQTIAGWAARILFAVLLMIVGLAAIVQIVFWVLPDELGADWKAQLLGYRRINVPNSSYAGMSEDTSVRDWIRQCVTGSSLEPLPKELEKVLAPYSPDSVSIEFFDAASSKKTESLAQSTHVRKPNNQEMNVLQLSRAIRSQRQDLVRTVEDSYYRLQIMQLLIIIIGLITTILVSISSTDFGKGDGTVAKSIRVLAIVFPALGTAAAALNSFYSPRDEMTRASHTLASLSQLHGQISVGIWGIPCAADSSESKDFKTVLIDWGKRYQDILAVGDAASSSSSDRSQGGSSGKGGAGQAGAGQAGQTPGG